MVELVLQVICRRADAHKEQSAFQASDDDCALAKLDSDSDRPDGASGSLARARRVGPIGRVFLAAVLVVVEIVVVVASVGASRGADYRIGRTRSG